MHRCTHAHGYFAIFFIWCNYLITLSISILWLFLTPCHLLRWKHLIVAIVIGHIVRHIQLTWSKKLSICSLKITLRWRIAKLPIHSLLQLALMALCLTKLIIRFKLNSFLILNHRRSEIIIVIFRRKKSESLRVTRLNMVLCIHHVVELEFVFCLLR